MDPLNRTQLHFSRSIYRVILPDNAGPCAFPENVWMEAFEGIRMKYGRPTRILHALIAIGISLEPLLSLVMRTPKPGRVLTPLLYDRPRLLTRGG